MKKIEYHKPKMAKRKITPRFLLKRKSGFGRPDDVMLLAVQVS